MGIWRPSQKLKEEEEEREGGREGEEGKGEGPIKIPKGHILSCRGSLRSP